jgi:hypothetical protein
VFVIGADEADDGSGRLTNFAVCALTFGASADAPTTLSIDAELYAAGQDPDGDGDGTDGWGLSSDAERCTGAGFAGGGELAPMDGRGRDVVLGNGSAVFEFGSSSGSPNPGADGGGGLTALVVDVVNGHTVVFVGTSAGRVVATVAASVRGMASAAERRSATFAVDRGVGGRGAVQALAFAGATQTLYVLTANTTTAVRMDTCDRHAECQGCLSAGPYCGWCALAAACTSRARCPSGGAATGSDAGGGGGGGATVAREAPTAAADGRHWVQAVVGMQRGDEQPVPPEALCPAVTAVSPATFSVGVPAALLLTVQRLPEALPTGHEYRCVLGEYGTVAASYDANSSTVSCESASIARLVGSAHTEAVPVAVGYASVVGTANSSAAATVVQVARGGRLSMFDCSVLAAAGCDKCAASAFGCSWCPRHAGCTVTVADGGGDRGGGSVCDGRRSTAAACPRITAAVAPAAVDVAQPTTVQQLVLTGTFFPVPTSAAAGVADDRYVCQFDAVSAAAPDSANGTAADTGTNGTNNTNGTNGTNGSSFAAGASETAAVTQYAASFVNTSTLRCNLTASFWQGPAAVAAVRQAGGAASRALTVLYNGAPLDGALATVEVTLVDCTQQGLSVHRGGADCGLCSRAGPVGHGCGWCARSTSCATERACERAHPDGGSPWTVTLGECPRPRIDGFAPSSAPLAGGTVLVIRGANLGRTVADIGRVTAAGRRCVVQAFDPGAGRLEVRVPAADDGGADETGGAPSLPLEGFVTVALNVAGEVVAASTGRFRFVDPVVAAVAPSKTPMAGGTSVTVVGEHLAVGGQRTITVGKSRCLVDHVAADGSELSCTTAAVAPTSTTTGGTELEGGGAASSAAICLQVDGMVAAGTCAPVAPGAAIVFATVADPQVWAVEPATFPTAGGVPFVVTGTNLDAVGAPRLALSAAGGVEVTASSCLVQPGGGALSCVSPPYPVTGLDGPIGLDGLDVAVRFRFDGASAAMAVTYYPNPVVVGIDPPRGTAGSRVELSGVGLARSGTPAVFVGTTLATLAVVADTQIFVIIPANPDNSSDTAAIRLVLGGWSHTVPERFVYVGVQTIFQNVTQNVTIFRSGGGGGGGGGGPDVGKAFGGVVGAAVALVALFVVGSQLRSRLQQKALAELLDSMNEMEANMADVCRRGFAELQNDNLLTLNDDQQLLRTRGYPDFVSSILFDQSRAGTHPQPPPEAEAGYEATVDTFLALLSDRAFVVAMVGALEGTLPGPLYATTAAAEGGGSGGGGGGLTRGGSLLAFGRRRRGSSRKKMVAAKLPAAERTGNVEGATAAAAAAVVVSSSSSSSSSSSLADRSLAGTTGRGIANTNYCTSENSSSVGGGGGAGLDEPQFTIADRCHVAAMLQMVLHENPRYGFEVLTGLLDVLFEQPSTRRSPKQVLRRTESVAEKLLSSWLSCQLYAHVCQVPQNIAKPFYDLLYVLQAQGEKGPIDAITGAAMYTLNGDNLLRERIVFCRLKLVVTVQLSGGQGGLAAAGGAAQTIELEVNDCDTPRQCVEKVYERLDDTVRGSLAAGDPPFPLFLGTLFHFFCRPFIPLVF